MISYCRQSDGQVDYAFVLVADDEVVDKISLEDGLEDACDEGDYYELLPSVYPKSGDEYQCSK